MSSLLQNSQRPANWKSVAPTPPAQTTTFSLQPSLPRLPLPDLSRTLTKLKDSLRILAGDENEWRVTDQKIDDFSRSQLAKDLHERLERRRNEKEHWLEEFWDDAGYLKYRDTILVNVSYYYAFGPLTHLPPNQAIRAAAITRSALLQRRDLKQGAMPIDMNKTTALCMDTWRWMFDCCRIPGLDGSDWSVTGARPGDNGNSGHIVVLRDGCIWKVDISRDGRLVSTKELESQFRAICEDSRTNTSPVGLLTSNHRDVWAKDFAALRDSSPKNAASLEGIATAAFVVCLDSTSPKSRLDHSMLCFHGGEHGEQLGNRWLDKPAQFIVFENGDAGYMGEHSVMDGTPSVTLCDRVLTTLWEPKFDHGESTAASSNSALPSPQPLDFDIGPETSTAISNARVAADAIISGQATGMLTVPYGKDEIKKLGVSPDAWAQMIIQLAYHRFTGGKRDGGTYEAASTRGFLKGRTETVRIVTEQAVRWCEAMDGKEDGGKEERRRMFLEACKRQGEDAREAGRAMGVDRHLFGLKNVLNPGEQLPEMFSDPLYVRGSTWVVSTSAIFSPHFTQGYGWGQVVPNGFGVAYMTGFNDRLEFTVTSKKEMPNAEFVRMLKGAAEDVRILFGDGDGKVKLKSRL